MEQDFNKKHWSNPCPKYDCRKKDCKCGLKYVNIPSSLSSEFTPVKGAYCNAIVEYEDTGDIYIYSKEGIPTRLDNCCPSPEEDVISLSVRTDDSSWRGATADYTVGSLSGEILVGSSILYPAQGNSGLFVNDDTGEFVTVEQAYKLIDSGKTVVFNHVPIGRDLLNPSLHTTIGWFDGIELSVKYSAEVDGSTATYYSASVFHPINNMAPPMGVSIRKWPQELYDEYAFIVQGKIYD